MKRALLAGLMLFATSVLAEPVETAVVEYRDLPEMYGVDGVVEAVRQSTVSAQIAGRVKQVLFDVGDQVKKGQIILRIDEREAAQALAGSHANVLQAQANLANARSNYERAKQLFAQKFISQAGLDKAQADYQVALAQAAASEAGAEQATLAHGYTSVVAPYAGTVAARLVEVGEMVVPGKPLMTGFDPKGMRVIVSIPQIKLVDIGAQPQVTVEIPSQQRQIQAASATVQPIADSRTHSTQVRVYLPDEASNIYPGMFVRANFVVGKSRRLVVPSRAVLRRSEVVAAYVMDADGKTRLRQIRIGKERDGLSEVLAGLKENEKVALDPVKAGMANRGQD